MLLRDVVSLLFASKKELDHARLPSEQFRATNAVVDLRVGNGTLLYNYGVADFLVTNIFVKNSMKSNITLPLLLRSGETCCLFNDVMSNENECIIIGYSLNDMQYIHAFHRTVQTGFDECYHYLRNDLCSSVSEYAQLFWQESEPLFNANKHIHHRVTTVPNQSILLVDYINRLGFCRA